ncbi:hypothetical protein EXIGLDRAFT_403494 [Exidia glandulosa HHB12029]|uniref:C6H2-type domain-containing protein n=1 Tax=Exidia glandulosa HHB12029 TaxID=1314781 RepID=A0A165KRP0_EXIGL|nr:hypothetical protein EXIGLDRAFT_403494 [Exidia glandulosa HHB12029]
MTDAKSNICSLAGCGNVATMRCPKCHEFGRSSFFCSQDHFKQAWSTHKTSHLKPKPALPAGVNVVSSEADIARATDTLRKIREFAEAAATAPCPTLTPEEQANCERKLRGTPGSSKPNWYTGNFRDLLTPNTMMRFETPRLVVRSVKPADTAWTYSVKGDPRVNKYQLYGQPSSKADAASFAHGYIRDRILTIEGLRRDGVVERHRYVFAITPKASEIPTPKSNAIPRKTGLPPFPPLPHEDDIYIGNIAFELHPLADALAGRTTQNYQGPNVIRVPSDEPFVWPDIESASARAELDQWTAVLFYEIAPQYWGQGLMLKAILSIADFVFYELGVGYMRAHRLSIHLRADTLSVAARSRPSSGERFVHRARAETSRHGVRLDAQPKGICYATRLRSVTRRLHQAIRTTQRGSTRGRQTMLRVVLQPARLCARRRRDVPMWEEVVLRDRVSRSRLGGARGARGALQEVDAVVSDVSSCE